MLSANGKCAPLTVELDVDPDVGKSFPNNLPNRKWSSRSPKKKACCSGHARPARRFVVEDIQLRFVVQVVPYLALPSDVRLAIAKVHGAEEEQKEEMEEVESTSSEPQLTQEELAEESQELTKELIAGLDGREPQTNSKWASPTKSRYHAGRHIGSEVEKLTNAIISKPSA